VPGTIRGNVTAILTFREAFAIPFFIRIGPREPIEGFRDSNGNSAVQLPALPVGSHVIQQSANKTEWQTVGVLTVKPPINWTLIWGVLVSIIAVVAVLSWRYYASLQKRKRQKRSDEGERLQLPTAERS
jgi:hypothetical protein